MHVMKYFITSSLELLLGRTNRMKLGGRTFHVGKLVGKSSVGRCGHNWKDDTINASLIGSVFGLDSCG
jgi:hypothetical protein